MYDDTTYKHHSPNKYDKKKIVTFLTPLMRANIIFFKISLFIFRHLFTKFHNNNDDNIVIVFTLASMSEA